MLNFCKTLGTLSLLVVEVLFWSQFIANTAVANAVIQTSNYLLHSLLIMFHLVNAAKGFNEKIISASKIRSNAEKSSSQNDDILIIISHWAHPIILMRLESLSALEI